MLGNHDTVLVGFFGTPLFFVTVDCVVLRAEL